MADQPVTGEDAAPCDKAPVGQPVSSDVEDDDPSTSHPCHLAEEAVQRGAVKVVGELHGDHQVDGPIREGEAEGIALDHDQ